MDDQPFDPDRDCGQDDDRPVVFTPRELALIREAESGERDGTLPAAEVHAWVASHLTPNPLPMPLPRTRG
jgi:hypothetical protein